MREIDVNTLNKSRKYHFTDIRPWLRVSNNFHVTGGLHRGRLYPVNVANTKLERERRLYPESFAPDEKSCDESERQDSREP